MILTLMRVLFVEAGLAHARAKGDVLVFRTVFGLRLLLGVGVAFFLIGIVKSYGSESGLGRGYACRIRSTHSFRLAFDAHGGRRSRYVTSVVSTTEARPVG
jgi:hypothetical protein